MEQLELFPLNEWTITEPPARIRHEANGRKVMIWVIEREIIGTTLSFTDGTKKWVYKLSHIEE